jgi:hypothetical protein
MRYSFFLLFSLILFLQLQLFAQTEKGIAGIYQLQGVMETAAGFQLKPDQTFDYVFTYGAADKWGKGTWKIAGTKLLLTSNHTQPASDFILQKSDASRKGGVVVKITDAQGRPLQYVKCRLGGEAGESKITNEKGEANFKTKFNGKLEVYHPIYTLRASELQLNPKHTNFLIQPAGDLSEVFFKDFSLEVSGEQLIAPELPGMPLEDAAGKLKRYVFQKEK